MYGQGQEKLPTGEDLALQPHTEVEILLLHLYHWSEERTPSRPASYPVNWGLYHLLLWTTEG